jgi:hypothetical protein
LRQLLICWMILHASFSCQAFSPEQDTPSREVELIRANALEQERRLRNLGTGMIASAFTVVAGTSGTLHLSHQALQYSRTLKILSVTGAAVAVVGAVIYYLHSGHPDDLTPDEVRALLRLPPERMRESASNPRFAELIHFVTGLRGPGPIGVR